MDGKTTCIFSLEQIWNDENTSQLGAYFSYYTNQAQDFLGKGNEQPAKKAQKALGSLAGVVALYRHSHLHNTPAQDDNANGPDAGENKVGQIVHNTQGIVRSIDPKREDIRNQYQRGPTAHIPAGLFALGRSTSF